MLLLHESSRVLLKQSEINSEGQINKMRRAGGAAVATGNDIQTDRHQQSNGWRQTLEAAIHWWETDTLRLLKKDDNKRDAKAEEEEAGRRYLWCQTLYLGGHAASVCSYATVVTLAVGWGARGVILNPINNHHIYLWGPGPVRIVAHTSLLTVSPEDRWSSSRASWEEEKPHFLVDAPIAWIIERV